MSNIGVIQLNLILFICSESIHLTLKPIFISIYFLTICSLNTVAQRHGSKTNVIVEDKSLKFIGDIELNNNSGTKTKIVSTHEVTTPIISHDAVLGGIEELSAIQFKYAQILNTEVELIQNKSLYNFIEDWWETSYRYGGSTKEGIDCSAFTAKLQSTIYQVALPRTAREQYSLCRKINNDEVKEGDLVFFNTSRRISHVGVYLSNGYFVHASTSLGVYINNLSEDYYSARFVGYGRINTTDDTQSNNK